MVKTKVIIDSNVFVAFYNSNDSLHDKAVLVLGELKDCELIIHSYVIQEVSTILAYRFGKNLANTFIHEILSSKNVMIIDSRIVNEMNSFLKNQKKFSFVDHALLALSQETNIPLITFDKDLLRAYKI